MAVTALEVERNLSNMTRAQKERLLAALLADLAPAPQPTARQLAAEKKITLKRFATRDKSISWTKALRSVRGSTAKSKS